MVGWYQAVDGRNIREDLDQSNHASLANSAQSRREIVLLAPAPADRFDEAKEEGGGDCTRGKRLNTRTIAESTVKSRESSAIVPSGLATYRGEAD